MLFSLDKLRSGARGIPDLLGVRGSPATPAAAPTASSATASAAAASAAAALAALVDRVGLVETCTFEGAATSAPSLLLEVTSTDVAYTRASECTGATAVGG